MSDTEELRAGIQAILDEQGSNISKWTFKKILGELESQLGVSLNDKKDEVKRLLVDAMSEQKKKKNSKAEEEGEEEEEEQPTKKRKAEANDKSGANKKPAKATSSSSSSSSPEINKEKDGSLWISLTDSELLRARVSKFKSMTLVDIRKYYKDKSGEIKPGNKGVSLTPDQWNAVKANIDTIDGMLSKIG